MEQLFVEVDSSDIILGTNEQTHGLLRIHTDECVCGKDAEVTTEFGPRKSLLELNASLSTNDSPNFPPSMCTDRLPGTYCPFGDPAECDCLEFFTSTLSPLSDAYEDPAYIEGLLDELSSSLSDISDADLYDESTSSAVSYDRDSLSATSDTQTRFLHALQLTSTPVHRRHSLNPVLANIMSPVFDENLIAVRSRDPFEVDEEFSTAVRTEVAFEQEDKTVSEINSVLKKCDPDDSLELFGMIRLKETDVADISGVIEEGSREEGWWAPVGPYVKSIDYSASQLLLPNIEQVKESKSLFFD